MTRVCLSCAATPTEAPFPVRGRTCLECAAAAARAPLDKPARIMTRASYRARLRVRQRSDQMDMIDMIQVSP